MVARELQPSLAGLATTFLILLAGAHHFAGAGTGHREIREIGQNLSDCIHGRRVVSDNHISFCGMI